MENWGPETEVSWHRHTARGRARSRNPSILTLSNSTFFQHSPLAEEAEQSRWWPPPTVNWLISKLGNHFLKKNQDFSHSHGCSWFSSMNVVRDFVLVLWVWERVSQKFLLPNSQKQTKTKTTTVINWNLGCCISRRQELLYEVPLYRIINRKFRDGHHISSETQPLSREMQRAWWAVKAAGWISVKEHLLFMGVIHQRNLAWLSFVTGIKWEARPSWHLVKVPVMSCAVHTLHFVWDCLVYLWVTNLSAYTSLETPQNEKHSRQFSISSFIGEKTGGWILNSPNSSGNEREDGCSGGLPALSVGPVLVNNGGGPPGWLLGIFRTIWPLSGGGLDVTRCTAVCSRSPLRHRISQPWRRGSWDMDVPPGSTVHFSVPQFSSSLKW